MAMRYPIYLFHPLLLLLFFPSSADAQHYPSDTDALIIFRTLADAHANLASNWTTPDACTGRWLGVGCSSGTNNRRVVSLSLPSLDLRGPLDPLSHLRRLRLLDLHDNRLNGTLHTLLPSLPNLKLLYLSHNDISGQIPAGSAISTRLLRLDLSDNNLQGPIPTATFSALTRLLTLRLDNNLLSGPVPDLSKALPNLTLFNVSNNQLSGPVPDGVRAKFGIQCLSGNAGLCGPIPPLPLCSSSSLPPKVVPSNPSSMPAGWNSSSTANNASISIDVDGGGDDEEKGSRGRSGVRRREIVVIAVGNAALLLLLLLSLLVAACCCCQRQQHLGEKEVVGGGGKYKGAQVEDHDHDDVDERSSGDSYSQLEKGRKKEARVSSEEGEEAESKLVFFDQLSNGSNSDSNSDGSGGRRQRQFGLEELLRASAEMVGKGSVGTVYRAVLEDGRMVAVKRLRDSNPCPRDDFHNYMNLIGRLSHPNLVPLRAFYYAKQEKLLVYDYLPNATLYSLLHHGNRGAGRSPFPFPIPVDWTTRMGLVLGAARGLAHIHHRYRSSKIPHGNIKSANVLLDEDGAPRISDFGLALLLNPAHAVARLGGYKAPEQQLSQEADVYGFGVLLLEVLTGKAPAQHPRTMPVKNKRGEEEDGLNLNLPEWVRSVGTEEVFDAELMRYNNNNNNTEEEMVAMLHVALACVAPLPDRRPTMNQVVKMIEDITAAPDPDLDHSRVSLSPSIPTLTY